MLISRLHLLSWVRYTRPDNAQRYEFLAPPSCNASILFFTPATISQEAFRSKKDFKNDFFGGALAGAFIGLQRKSMHSVVTSSVTLGVLAITTAYVYVRDATSLAGCCVSKNLSVVLHVVGGASVCKGGEESWIRRQTKPSLTKPARTRWHPANHPGHSFRKVPNQ